MAYLLARKYEFMVPSVQFLGYREDGEGRHPIEAPSPKNVAELLSYLGLLNFYGHFIRNLSTLDQPLHKLLQKDVKWYWSKECEETFQQNKPGVMDGCVLVSFDDNRKLILACRASR